MPDAMHNCPDCYGLCNCDSEDPNRNDYIHDCAEDFDDDYLDGPDDE